MKIEDVREGMLAREGEYIVRIEERLPAEDHRGSWAVKARYVWPFTANPRPEVLHSEDLELLDPAWLGAKYQELLAVIEEYERCAREGVR